MTSSYLGRACTFILLFYGAVAAHGAEPIYQDDPEVVAKLQSLQPGQSLLLPGRYLADGEPVKDENRRGPYARDYTNKMAYAPDRETAFYCGGNHNDGRTNDVWEYHLGSNTWHRLHPSEGGDHARFKFALMFYPQELKRDPNFQPNERQTQQIAEAKQWWLDNVELVDGNFVMKRSGAPILPSHTWDELMYDPVNKRLVHGLGAHTANEPWLQHKFAGEPLEAILAKHGRRADGVPWRTPWTFDPVARRWRPYANSSELADLRGYGASLVYISDQKQAVWYYAGQNWPGAPHVMALWDLTSDAWTELKPNGGRSLSKLALEDRVAPESEQQMAYAAKYRTIVAVWGETTWSYDFDKNEWSRLNDAIPIRAHDAESVFAYDSASDVFLLSRPRENQLAAFDLKTNVWRRIEPNGPAVPKPPYGAGFGYYDPKFDVLVIRPAYQQSMWFYRHGKK